MPGVVKTTQHQSTCYLTIKHYRHFKSETGIQIRNKTTMLIVDTADIIL